MSYARSFSVKAEVNGDIREEQKKLALNIDQGVVFETPVDTGRAKVNWIVTNHQPTNKKLPEPANSGSANSQSMKAAQKEIGKVEPYSLTYIQNNLPYIDKLNLGHSAQAPAYFIEKVITRVVNNTR